VSCTNLSFGGHERSHRYRFRAEPGFSAAASFGSSVDTGFPFGLHQGIRIGGTGCSVLMIRNFNRSQPTFTTSGPWPMHLQAPTGW